MRRRPEPEDDRNHKRQRQEGCLRDVRRVGQAVDRDRAEAGSAGGNEKPSLRIPGAIGVIDGVKENARAGQEDGPARDAEIIERVDIAVVRLDILDRKIAAICVVQEAKSVGTAAEKRLLAKDPKADRYRVVSGRER